MSAPVTSPGWRGGLLYALAAVGLASVVFAWGQNAGGQVGGPISLEKSLWLNFTISAWFVVPAFLVRHPAVDPALRVVLGAFLASMVARGLAELWLIYVAFGWSPVYGIAHDLSCIAMIAWLRVARGARRRARDAFNRDVFGFCTLVQASLVAEIVFAALFYRTGLHRDAVYFAAATEEFRRINMLTRWVDVAVYAGLVTVLVRQRAVLFRGAARAVHHPYPTRTERQA